MIRDTHHRRDALDVAWQDQAACRAIPEDLWFGDASEFGLHGAAWRSEREAAAKAVCDGCPVRARCLEHAVSTPEFHGIWGGRTEVELASIRRSPAARREVARAAEIEAAQ